jgi:hypothetical protein
MFYTSPDLVSYNFHVCVISTHPPSSSYQILFHVIFTCKTWFGTERGSEKVHTAEMNLITADNGGTRINKINKLENKRVA